MVKTKLLKIEVASLSHFTNTYFIYDDDSNAILIDPAYSPDIIMQEIKNNNFKIMGIIITHAHADHFGALEELSKNIDCKIYIHENDKEGLLSLVENCSSMLNVKKQNIDEKRVETVKDGDLITFGKINVEIIHTPGHTAGSICIYEKNLNALFTGDTIFEDCYGRCDLYSGDINMMAQSLKKVFDRFNDIMIYPGHDESVNIESSKKKIRLLMALKGIKI